MSNPLRQPKWQIESAQPELAESLKTKLREVIDPEIGLNIIELGMVRDVIVEDETAKVTMILTTPFCPYGPAMMETTRKTAADHLGLDTTIEMGMEVWDTAYMEEGVGADWGLF